jgi:hypothetical protein
VKPKENAMTDRRAVEARSRGERRLTALTAGVAAASVVGVGVVVAYDAHLFNAPTPASASTSGSARESGDDDSSTQQQSTTTVPVTTQQAPQATSGGS